MERTSGKERVAGPVYAVQEGNLTFGYLKYSGFRRLDWQVRYTHPRTTQSLGAIYHIFPIVIVSPRQSR